MQRGPLGGCGRSIVLKSQVEVLNVTIALLPRSAIQRNGSGPEVSDTKLWGLPPWMLRVQPAPPPENPVFVKPTVSSEATCQMMPSVPRADAVIGTAPPSWMVGAAAKLWISAMPGDMLK